MTDRQFHLIVRDSICIPKQRTDAALKRLDCYYVNTLFSWDGTFSSLDSIFDEFQKDFHHFIDWTATVIPV